MKPFSILNSVRFAPGDRKRGPHNVLLSGSVNISIPIVLALFVALIATSAHRGLAQDTVPGSESLLPESTKGWVSVPDAKRLREALSRTRMGSMSDDPALKPFVDDLVRQFRSYLDEQNIRFGITIDDVESVQSGEICLAGVLRPPVAGETEADPDHAVVLMIDVQESRAEAEALLVKVGEEMIERKATSEVIRIGEVEATKWTFPQPVGLRARQHAIQGIIGRWLIASDNEAVFRDLVSEIAGVENGGPAHLVDNPVFARIKDRTSFDDKGLETHFRWFIEPFGYVYLAQAIADAQNPGKPLRNDYVRIFQEQGFGVIKGAGGAVSLATGDHEAVHRTFVYAPLSEEGALEKAAVILDFENNEFGALEPQDWIPEDTASYLTFSWDLRNALENVGLLAESLAGTEGSWVRTLDAIRDDPNGQQVDLRRVADLLEDRVTVISATKLPIDVDSEHLVFGIRIKDDPNDPDYVQKAVFKYLKAKAEIIQHEGVDILVVNTEDDDGDTGLKIEGGDPDFDFDSDFSDEPEEDEEEFKKPKPLFATQVVTVKDGYLFIGNNVERVKTILSELASAPGKRLTEAEDYRRVNDALAELAGGDDPNFRHFGRMDLSLRPNYEMMRTGQMAQSKTLLAQLLNRGYEENKDPDASEERKQLLDGSQMPEDYEGEVAKYFGPTGLVVHTVEDGWLITGCILTKQFEQPTADSASSESDPSDESSD